MVADAKNTPVSGINEGYNPINTAVYGLYLSLVCICLYELFRNRFDAGVKMESKLVFALTPFFTMGGMVRALEDAAFFSEPTAYLFIAPFIYVSVACLAALSIIISTVISKKSAGSYRLGMLLTFAFILSLAVIYSFFQVAAPTQTRFHVHPAVLIALSAIVMLVFYSLTRVSGKIEAPVIIGSVGLFFTLNASYIMLNWTSAREWFDKYMVFSGKIAVSTHIGEIGIIIGIALLLTFVMYSVSAGGMRLFPRMREHFKPLVLPITILMIFSQFLDGCATYRGVDFYGYSEKHVIPAGLIAFTGTAAVVILLKLILIVVVVYLLDIHGAEESQKNPHISIIVKTLLITLGLAPGVRDMCRIAMGV